MSDEQRPITVQGFEALRAEVERLIKEERPKVIAAIAEARGHGDLSENAEYDAAKNEQALLEKKISQMQSNIANSQIIDISDIKEDKIVFGATVTIQNTETDEKRIFQIVGEDEADLKKGKISIKAPIAKALIGKRIEDEVIVSAPGGEIEYVIINFKYL
ncbi:MAG: transcription elongation factor GreA [Pseudomonadota bacterium]